jgi:hypothetical protein
MLVPQDLNPSAALALLPVSKLKDLGNKRLAKESTRTVFSSYLSAIVELLVSAKILEDSTGGTQINSSSTKVEKPQLELDKLDSTMVGLTWNSTRPRDGSSPDRFVYELEAEIKGNFQTIYKGMALSWSSKQLVPRTSYKFRLRALDTITNNSRFPSRH